MKRFLLVILASLVLFSISSPLSCSQKKEPVVVAYSPFEATALFWIAHDRQYFDQNGVSVILHKYDTGAAALSGVLNAEADVVVGLSEFPVVRMAFQKKKMAVIGNADKGEFIYMVGRRDRGIERVSDLTGKKVGVAFGTIAQFYLGRFLELSCIKSQSLTIVDLKTPKEWINAVVDGEVDAVVTAQPDANIARERLGANSIFWPVQSGQNMHGLIVSSREWFVGHSGLATGFLRSIAQAEQFAIRSPVEAKNIVQKRLNLEAGYMDTVWNQNQFALSLDQSLIAAMEDEARWMIDNKLTEEKQIPDFTDYIYEDALKIVNPGMVNIIR